MSATGSASWACTTRVHSTLSRASVPLTLSARRYGRFFNRSRRGNGQFPELLERSLVLSIGAEVVPRFDLVQRPLGPRLDRVEEADEEVNRERADVDLILCDCHALEELLLDLSTEPEHLSGIVEHQLEGRDDLLLGPQRRYEETDHGRLEVHGERGDRRGEPRS